MSTLDKPTPSASDANDDYDRLVQESAQGSIFCTRWWLDAVAPECYRILEYRKGDQLLAAWPLVFQSSGSTASIEMPRLTQKLGIVFAPMANKYAEQLSKQTDIMQELISSLPEFETFQQNFHENFGNWLPFYWQDFGQTTRYTYVMEDLSGTDTMWDGLRSHIRTKIRKAEKSGASVASDATLDEFLDLNDKVFERQGLRFPVSRDFVRRIDDACQAHAGRRVIAVRGADGELLAGVYVVWHAGTSYAILGASDPETRNSGAYILALWEACKFASTISSRFDFGGSMMPQIEPVFRGFGTTQTPYFNLTKSTVEPWVSTRTLLRMATAKIAGPFRRVLKSS